MGMNSIGIIPGHVLNLHPAPLLPAMYRYFYACLFLAWSLSLAFHPATSKHPTAAAASQPASPANEPTNRFPATHSLSSLMSLATHSLNPPAQSIRSSLKVVALSTDASFSLPLIPTKSSCLIPSRPLPFILPAFIGVQNPSQL